MRVKRVSFPELSEEGGVQCGVWETTVEQRVGDGDMGRPPNLKSPKMRLREAGVEADAE